MSKRTMLLLAILLVSAQSRSAAQDITPPQKVSVVPVFLSFANDARPKGTQQKLALQHLTLAQAHYRKALDGKSTFNVFGKRPLFLTANFPAASYLREKDQGTRMILGELLQKTKVNRFTCPFVYLVFVVSRQEFTPKGYPINGGLNRGGAIAIVPYAWIDRVADFQSTVRRCLGRAFGLPPTSFYGFKPGSTPSLMDSNPAIAMTGFTAGRVSPILLSEEKRAIALNDKVFGYTWDSKKDSPKGRELSAKVFRPEPLEIPGQPNYEIAVSSLAGEDLGTKVENIRSAVIPSNSEGGISFDPVHMWHTDTLSSGWAEVFVEFPLTIQLDRITVHTQHSASAHKAERIEIRIPTSKGIKSILTEDLKQASGSVDFPPTISKRWIVRLKSGDSKKICVRGIQFFFNSREIMPLN